LSKYISCFEWLTITDDRDGAPMMMVPTPLVMMLAVALTMMSGGHTRENDG
jgi:hypothetical protein